jgi:hypothetical protein
VNKRRRLGAFLKRWVIVVIPAAVAILIGAGGLSHGHYTLFGHSFAVSWTIITAAALLALLEAAIVVRRQLRVASLAAERDELLGKAVGAEHGIVRLMRVELAELQVRAHQFSSERVNLFRCDGDHFTLVARHSPRPLFHESLGRGSYPIDQGVLGRAWAQGTADEPSLPSAGGEQGPPRRAWLDAQRRLGVPEDVARGLTMRSQAYAAFRIAGRERSLGVILFESTVAVDEAAGAGASPTMRTVADLEPLVKEAGGRLASLLEGCSVIDAARVRALLDEQQGPASRP